MASRAKLDELRDLVRARGLRVTPSRIAVLGLLLGSEQPLSHGEVAQKLAGQRWDPATLYRNLIDLSEAGFIRRRDVGDHVWRFEAVRGGHEPNAHPHFVCTECGTVECLPTMELVATKAKTPRAVKRREIEVQVRGLCDGCAA